MKKFFAIAIVAIGLFTIGYWAGSNTTVECLVESIDKHDLDVLETLIDAVAATPHNGDDYYLGSYKEDIARYRKELKEWEEEKATWED